jgi:hypothetical protein
VAQLATQQALFAVSGLGPFVQVAKFIGDGVRKLTGRERKPTPFAKVAQSDPTRSPFYKWRKSELAAVKETEAAFQSLLQRQDDVSRMVRFLSAIETLEQTEPYWFQRLQPEFLELYAQVLSTPIDTMAPLYAEPVYEIPRPAVSQLQPFAGFSGADSNRALAAIETGSYSLPTKILPRPKPEIVPGVPSNVGSAFNDAPDTSAPPDSRRTGGALLFLIALAALAVLS